MIVRKILNNNLILATGADGSEQIVMGRGLRFLNQVGEKLHSENVQKVYVLRDRRAAQHYMELVSRVPRPWAEAVQQAIQDVQEQLPKELSNQIFVTLFDHLVYALERCQKGIVLQNRLLWEVKQFYPREYALGLQMTRTLNGALPVQLPEEEAGNIAFHLVNAQTESPDLARTTTAMRMLKDIFGITQMSLGKKIDESSIHYTRFVTHLQFFLERVLDHKMLSTTDLDVFEGVAARHPEALTCAQRIQDYIKKNLGTDIPREELMYLTIHIVRISR